MRDNIASFFVECTVISVFTALALCKMLLIAQGLDACVRDWPPPISVQFCDIPAHFVVYNVSECPIAFPDVFELLPL